MTSLGSTQTISIQRRRRRTRAAAALAQVGLARPTGKLPEVVAVRSGRKFHSISAASTSAISAKGHDEVQAEAAVSATSSPVCSAAADARSYKNPNREVISSTR